MKLHLLIISIMIFGSFALAQSSVPSMKSAPAVENWQTFAPDKEEFTLEIPALALPGFINDRAEKTTTSRFYNTFINGSYYFMFSDSLKDPDLQRMVFDFAKEMGDRNTPNVVFRFPDGSGFYHRILTIKTKNRIYTFQTVSGTEKSPSLDRFFAGIKINGKTLELKESISNVAQIPIPQNVPLPVSDKAVYDVSGTGSGIGYDTGNGSRTEGSKASTTPLKILSKPSPPYTKYARFYQIAGVVRMRVTFLANGTIGSVTTLTKLPFGLTEEAVAAARQIKFEPYKLDGQPQNVMRQVEYNFVIY
jgi:hypothetical protein